MLLAVTSENLISWKYSSVSLFFGLLFCFVFFFFSLFVEGMWMVVLPLDGLSHLRVFADDGQG